LRFVHKHPQIPAGAETQFLEAAFTRDFQTNGPSVVRIARTTLAGWRRYRNHPDKRIRARFKWESRELATTFAGSLWAARKYFAGNQSLVARIEQTLTEIKKEFGLRARLIAPLAGRFIHRKIEQESRRLQAGFSYEPPTFYEHNFVPARK
jgi:hypothetical protein